MSSPLFEHGTLLSPMDGIVTTVSINPNEVFMPNSALLTIEDVSTVLVHARVPLNYFGQLHLKQRATVTPSAPSSSAIEGTITNIIPQNDPQSDTFEVWVSVPNHTMALLPGMSALVNVQTAIQAMVVPRLSVLSPEATASVFVVRDQIVHLQQVQVLGRSVTSIYITGNIFPGEQIVLVGLDTLRDGQRVRITEGTATLF
jgi:RND family efflux transporter MFP subunit